MAGDAATNAAARVRPSHEELNQLDHPAEDNVWHDAPDFSKGTMKDKLGKHYKGNPKEDARVAAAEGTSTAHPTGSSNPRDLAATTAQDRMNGGSSGVNAVGGAVNAAGTLRQRADENIDQETKDMARAKNEEYRARTRQYFSRKMPQERRDQTVWRLKVCQSHFYLTETV